MSNDLRLVAKARELTSEVEHSSVAGEQAELYGLVDSLADALEAATWRYAELLVAGKPQRQANRRQNAGLAPEPH